MFSTENTDCVSQCRDSESHSPPQISLCPASKDLLGKEYQAFLKVQLIFWPCWVPFLFEPAMYLLPLRNNLTKMENCH